MFDLPNLRKRMLVAELSSARVVIDVAPSLTSPDPGGGIVIPDLVDTFGNTRGGCPQDEVLLTFNVWLRVTTSRPQCVTGHNQSSAMSGEIDRV